MREDAIVARALAQPGRVEWRHIVMRRFREPLDCDGRHSQASRRRSSFRTNSRLRGPDGAVGASHRVAQPGARTMKAFAWKSVATLGVAIGVVSTPLSAQKAGLGFGASIGANVPNGGDFGSGAKTGLVANGFVGVGTTNFGLRGELFWSRSDLDNAVIRRVGNQVLPSGGDRNVSGNVDLI